MLRMIACDLDGTLLKDHKSISATNLEAIKKAKAKGIKFAIVSGRDYSSVKELIGQYELACPAVVCNGAEIRNVDGEIIHSIPFDLENATIVFDAFKKHGIDLMAFNEDYILTTATKDEYARKTLDSLLKRGFATDKKEATGIMHDFDKKREVIQISSAQELIDYKVNKIESAHFGDNNKNAGLELNLIRSLSLVIYPDASLEITMAKANKGDGLKYLIKQYDLDIDEIAVFGDSSNDLPMFEAFSNNYVMSNAHQTIKLFANNIVDNEFCDGVGKTVLELIKQVLYS